MGSPFVAVYRLDLNPYINPRSQGGFVRFFIAMFSHETNTFSTLPSDRRQFEARDLRYGGELLRAVRATVGPAVPVAVTLDFHANVTEDMVRHATLLHGYKTYPHVDMDARGREAIERLLDVGAGRLRPTVAWRQPPLLPPIASQLTARGPMRLLYDRAAEMERDPRV